MSLPDDLKRILRSLNPWWDPPHAVRPAPPAYRRPVFRGLAKRLSGRPVGGIMEILRGPRQVGKSTGMLQVVEDLLDARRAPRDLLFVRFDLQTLREAPEGLRGILAWYATQIRGRPLDAGPASVVFLDEVHKLPRWDEEVKHAFDTHPLRLVLTGSSSVLVARGERESFGGRSFASEVPPFSFREVLELSHPEHAEVLPEPMKFVDAFDEGRLRDQGEATRRLRAQQRLVLSRDLDRYFARGGYPRLHTGEIEDDRWAEYLEQTVFENVLGSDIPELFRVRQPLLLRHLYLAVARQTGSTLSQGTLAEDANVAGHQTNQVTVGNYLRALEDALLIRSFRRYPLVRRSSQRTPSKIALNDLGVRNAILRDAPSLGQADPRVLGPLVETLAHGVMRGTGLHVHFWRERAEPSNRRSQEFEVDYVGERTDGAVLPVEIKYRRAIRPEDRRGLVEFMGRHEAGFGVLVTQSAHTWHPRERILELPLLDFLLAF